MTSLGRDVNPWGVTYDEAVQELKASANKLGSSWTKLLFGDQSAGTEGVAYLSAGLESIIFSPGCIREDEATCYGPEHPYFSGTSKGLNQTMSSLIMEALIFAEEERSAVLTGWRFGFIWEVTYVDLQHGVDLVSPGTRLRVVWLC